MSVSNIYLMEIKKTLCDKTNLKNDQISSIISQIYTEALT